MIRLLLSFYLSVVMLCLTPSISSAETVCSSKRQHTWGMNDRNRWAKYGNESKSCYDRWNGVKDLKTCSDHFICCISVKRNNTWNTQFTERIQEVKKRGLTCGMKTAISIKTPKNYSQKTSLTLMPPEENFMKLGISERKQVQSNLKALGLYTSSIDGLYGKGTATALSAYNKEYLGNADLKTTANANALITDLLKEQFVVIEKSEIKVEPVPTFTFAQVKAFYDAQNYVKAFKNIQFLAVEGDADAQLLLGKMYADGRGTLQVATAAHMWFNLAGMNGNDEAFEKRRIIMASMTPAAIENAQAMAVKCIQSKYKDCGLRVMPMSVKQLLDVELETDIYADLIKKAFISETLLRRKQIQYALKKLGFYKNSVDGLWGSGTSSALVDYALSSDAIENNPEELFVSIQSKVAVPSSFAVVKKPSFNVIEYCQSYPSNCDTLINELSTTTDHKPVKKEVSIFDLLGAFAEGYNAVDQGFQGSTTAPIETQTCFKTGDYRSGFNKICNYDCLGSAYVMTISSTSLCPLTVNR